MIIGTLTVDMKPSNPSRCPYCGDTTDKEPATHISGGRCPDEYPGERKMWAEIEAFENGR